MLEATQHPLNSFWTLTYNDDTVPLTYEGIPTLEQEDLTLFVKRLRKDYQPHKLRYFNVGEYGSQTYRPHYHLALFNYPGCARGVTQPNRQGDCCSVCDRVRRIWGKGIVYSGQLESASAAYISGYVTKKLTDKEALEWSGAPRIKPEFARMSLRPGIGASFIPEVASELLAHNIITSHNDVTFALRHGPTVKPLGRYLTRLLRTHVGLPANAPPCTIEAQQQKLQAVRDLAKTTAPKGLFTETFKALIIDVHEGKYLQQQAKEKLYRKRGYL